MTAYMAISGSDGGSSTSGSSTGDNGSNIGSSYVSGSGSLIKHILPPRCSKLHQFTSSQISCLSYHRRWSSVSRYADFINRSFLKARQHGRHNSGYIIPHSLGQSLQIYGIPLRGRPPSYVWLHGPQTCSHDDKDSDFIKCTSVINVENINHSNKSVNKLTSVPHNNYHSKVQMFTWSILYTNISI